MQCSKRSKNGIRDARQIFSMAEVGSCSGLLVVPKWSPSGPQVVHKWSPSGPQVVPKWSPSGPQVAPSGPKWSSSGPQVVIKWSVNSGCHKLSENIWFAWSNTCYKGEKVRCHACDIHTYRQTHTNVKVEQYSAEAESAKMAFHEP